MQVCAPKRRVLISYAAFYLAFAAVTVRAFFVMGNSPDAPFMAMMLGAYLLLLLAEPFLISRNMAFLYATNGVQAAIALILLLFVGSFDSFALLLLPPCAQAMLNFPRKTAVAWIATICVLMSAALLIHFPISESLGYVIIYLTGINLATGFCYLVLQAEESQQRSEALAADLQEANKKLQAYADQVQELTAVSERNRLARELHDSVTQIIFGLTLSAQAARILLDRDPSRVAAQLDHMQVLAQNALAEMRALIQQLHPRSVAEEGLERSLRRLVAEREASDGLNVELQIRGETHLPVNVEEELYHIAQEALNNIVKHARTNHAVIRLNTEGDGRVLMDIDDEGAGFDPASVRSLPGHLGLTSMTERVQALGGTLMIDSQPGNGTHLRIELALAREVEHA